MTPKVLTISTERERLPLNSACVVCGSTNPSGLHIKFYEEHDSVCADWMPNSDWESFRGTIHGGIVSTVLDEAMSKAIIAQHWEALTAELKVRLRRRTAPGERLHIRGWIVSKHRRRILAEATLTDANGEERAHAWGTFLTLPAVQTMTGMR